MKCDLCDRERTADKVYPSGGVYYCIDAGGCSTFINSNNLYMEIADEVMSMFVSDGLIAGRDETHEQIVTLLRGRLG